MIHAPSYLQKRNGLYYFRMRVPEAIRATHGPEIRLSLRTGNKTEAALLSRGLAVRYHAHFAKEPALKMATTRLPKDVGQLTFETPQGTLRTENNTPEEYAQVQEAIKALSSNQQQFVVAQVASAPLAPAQTGKLLSQAIEEFLAKMMPLDATGEISKEDCEDGWKAAKAQIERPSQLDALLTILGDQGHIRGSLRSSNGIPSIRSPRANCVKPNGRRLIWTRRNGAITSTRPKPNTWFRWPSKSLTSCTIFSR